jgi:hypothetical protein
MFAVVACSSKVEKNGRSSSLELKDSSYNDRELDKTNELVNIIIMKIRFQI